MARKNIFHLKQFSIDQTHAGMKVGTDSDLLGTMAHGGSRILDIGTGTGILTLMMAQRFPKALLTAIEIDENAVIDATANFSNSPWSDRITLHHIALQDYTPQHTFDAIVCNPPYFDKSLECPSIQRLRARHTSSLPFSTLVEKSYRMLEPQGLFSVCLPPEVLDDFCQLCSKQGFCLVENNIILSLPDNPPKRYILVFQKTDSNPYGTKTNTYCMRNPDHTYSQWYKVQLKDFLTGKIYRPSTLDT